MLACHVSKWLSCDFRRMWLMWRVKADHKEPNPRRSGGDLCDARLPYFPNRQERFASFDLLWLRLRLSSESVTNRKKGNFPHCCSHVGKRRQQNLKSLNRYFAVKQWKSPKMSFFLKLGLHLIPSLGNIQFKQNHFYPKCSCSFFVALGNLFSKTTCSTIKWMLIPNARI